MPSATRTRLLDYIPLIKIHFPIPTLVHFLIPCLGACSPTAAYKATDLPT